MNFAVTKLPFARVEGLPTANKAAPSAATPRPVGGLRGASLRCSGPQGAPQPRAPRARGALSVRCQSRPDSGSQPVYTALRALQPVLARHPSTEVRIRGADLATLLEAYCEDEKTLAREPGMRVALNVGLKAAERLGVLLEGLSAVEKKAEEVPEGVDPATRHAWILPDLRRTRATLTQRLEELQTLNWRSRLEMCVRAPSATKE